MELENRRLKNFEDALRQTPGVEIQTYGSLNTDVMRIRGVGSLYQIGMDDTSVLLNLDGVPQSLGMASMSIMDIERVEVMKRAARNPDGEKQRGRSRKYRHQKADQASGSLYQGGVRDEKHL